MFLLMVVVFARLDLEETPWAVLAALTAGSVACLMTGLRVKRGRRRLVLFLRRFGFSGASETLSFAVGTAIGRRYRLVTLDDEELAARGTPRATQRLVRGMRWGTLLLTVGGLALVYRWVHGGGAEALVGGLLDQIAAQARAQGTNVFAAIFQTLIVGLVVGIVVLLFAFVLMFTPLAIISTTGIFAWRAARSIRNAERSRQLTIAQQTAIEDSADAVIRRAQRIIAPRLVVVRCTDALWQRVVRRFADACQMILVDVSEPTASLIWELETIAGMRVPAIHVGQREKVERLTRSDAASIDNVWAARLRALLEGTDVLVYDDRDRPVMRRFAKALGYRLDQIASGQ